MSYNQQKQQTITTNRDSRYCSYQKGYNIIMLIRFMEIKTNFKVSTRNKESQKLSFEKKNQQKQ